jgi:hypothetical protein
LEIVGAGDFGAAVSLRISAFFGQPGNVMFCAIYDIIAKGAAAERFPAWMLLVDARKCHEMCGYVTFCEIFDVRLSPTDIVWWLAHVRKVPNSKLTGSLPESQ